MKNLNFKQRMLMGFSLTLVVSLILYLAGAFANATFVIYFWSSSARTGIAIFWVFAVLLSWVLSFVFDD